MKTFILSLLLAVGLLIPSQATQRTIVVKDTNNHVVRIYEVNDTVVNGTAQIDTLSITTLPDGQESISSQAEYHDSFWGVKEGEIALFSIFCIFFGPVLIIFFIFFFRYKSRKAAYRVAEQAIASGRPLPEQFMQTIKQKPANNSLSQGVNSICVGIGLFIFLWALTGEFGLGCIGLLIMFMGFGKVIIYYLQQGNPFNQSSPINQSNPIKQDDNQNIPTE